MKTSNRFITLFIGLGSFGFLSCGGEDLGECPADSNTQQLAGRQAVAQYCVVCHASQLSGAARHDAPDDINFDDLGTVKDEAESMYGEIKDGEMPPAGYATPTVADVENIRVWLACGAEDVR